MLAKLSLKHFVILIAIQFSIYSPFKTTCSAQEDFKSLLQNSYIATTIYSPPTISQLNLATSLFQSLLETRSFNSGDVTAWASLGFSLRKLNVEQQGAPGQFLEVAVISEFIPTQGKGHGFYAINLSYGNSKSISLNNNIDEIDDSTEAAFRFLQAPHRPSDLYTYQIIYELFTSGDYVAAGWSTTHRDNVDLCKEPMSYYNSFTIALANYTTVPTPMLIQLHGFDKHSYNSTADIIFSSTKNNNSQTIEFENIYNCLKNKLGPGSEWNFNVFQFPKEVQFLGGTLNLNAQNYYNQSTDKNGGFYHVETSRELRNVLYENEIVRKLFSDCFLL